ncbi:MAG: hemolysin family protein [bacterium]|jgi:CBS domain containing-hemolysin-like protein|nr:hemolysin family protein [bacterium]
MDDGSKPPLLWVILLLLGAAYCAITETALSSVSRNKIKASADHGNARAKRVLAILEDFDKAITTLLICTNIFHLATASIVTVYVTRRWGLDAVTLSTIITTVAVFFAAEMLPKSIGKKQPQKIILACAPLLSFLMKALSPIARFLTWIGRGISNRSKADAPVSVTEEELHDIIDEMAEEGTLDENQSDLISSALEFGDLTAESILTPRVDISAIDIDDDPYRILAFIKNQTHSRIPVYERSIDNIIGVIQIRKYLKSYLQTGRMPDIRSTMDKVYYAHQSTEIHELLPEMSKRKLNMAVITDSYGGTLGIVTVEDILESLVGEIWDETDVVQEPIIKIDEDTYLCEATQTLNAVFDFIDFDDPEDDEKDGANLQIGEWVYEQFTSIPKMGDSFEYHNLRVSVENIQHNRILQVRIQVLPKPEEDEEEDEK